MRDKTIRELADRLNQIRVEKNNLDIEYNEIIYELWKRIPDLQNDVNLQPNELVTRKKVK